MTGTVTGTGGRRLEREAAAIRWHLGLADTDRLDPLRLAATVPARVVTPDDFCDELLARRLRSVAWDGAALHIGGELVIVLNPARPPARRTATLMEELSHSLLGHAPTRIAADRATGVLRRSYDAAQEREAYELGATLLLPRAYLAAAVRARRHASAIARDVGCSEALVRYRLGRAGLARRYAKYARAA
jgi:Zn-dependent peptidase ImmA (M78 family)